MKQLLIVLFLAISFSAKSQIYPGKVDRNSKEFLYLDSLEKPELLHAIFLISDTSRHFANLISVNGYAMINGNGYVFFDAHKKRIKAPWYVWGSTFK